MVQAAAVVLEVRNLRMTAIWGATEDQSEVVAVATLATSSHSVG